MRSLTMLAAVLALSLGVFASPAIAGGWAVTTFDEMPGQFVAGQEFKLGYTIRQHGVTAINVDKTEILAVATSGRTLSFPGTSQGDIGHYVASVYFPAGGTYTWQVTQGAFAPQDLGTLSVVAAAGTSTADKGKTAADKAAAADKSAASDKAAAAAKAASAEKGTTVTTPVTAPATPSNDPLRTALPFAAAAAAAMFIWRLVTMVRTSRRTRATA
ncbi:MAG TPA: hypothetical protein VI056_12450 [Candidatus Limnocylindria bacterium]